MTTDSAPAPRSPLALLHAIAADIKLSHTVFALPFALLAMFLAAAGVDRLPSAAEWALILFCMVAARTFAMTFNRWADARLDADNPRTAGRALPAGRVTRPQMLVACLASAALLILGAAGFLLLNNPWPLLLSPAVLLVLALYSLTKRFTALCHLVLGVALGLSPLAAALAIEPAFLTRPDTWLLSGFVLGWVAGFDILYALADLEHDRQHNIFSIPARLGLTAALWLSRTLHLTAAALLVILAATAIHLGAFFALASGIALALLITEHAIVARSHTKHLDVAFFTLNGIISLILGAAGIVDVLMY
ncbi:UbiA-like polyprenyltransferase [Mucisphaera calidilacus]|uniref:4-hydroxybenzoate octaprenyltransferase n=1 Tax=Mucisphaera calidilacus TaxID=2527982 RepID=A0A518BV89_9BACT|nr:UbiA-like polyprenyltransferase [Mucisphaera calidilacus]QDU70900.1 4-hydroxybenzoate octaprenyltransferase [Mucisphaera calidilacus]